MYVETIEDFDFRFHGVRFNHDSQNSFSAHHDTRTPKMVDHGITKISLLPLPLRIVKLHHNSGRTPLLYTCTKSCRIKRTRGPVLNLPNLPFLLYSGRVPTLRFPLNTSSSAEKNGFEAVWRTREYQIFFIFKSRKV